MALEHNIYQRTGSLRQLHHLQDLEISATSPKATLLFAGGATIETMCLGNRDDDADVHFKFWNQADEPDPAADYPHMTLLAPRLNGADIVKAIYEPRNDETYEGDESFWHFTGSLWVAAAVGAGLSTTAPDNSNPAFALFTLLLDSLTE